MKVSKTYQSWKYDETKAYEKKGRLYVTATAPCPRCNGKGIIIARVENGKQIPIPVDQGICYQCNGAKTIKKEVRLYTDEEFEKKEAAAARAKEKKEKELEAKIELEYDKKRSKWLNDNGFNEEMYTYVYCLPNSYDVKEELKAAGFIFNRQLKWHISTVPAAYEDKVIKVHLNEVAQMTKYGTAYYLPEAEEKVNDAIRQLLPQPKSKWQGAIGQVLPPTLVSVVTLRHFQGRYGQTTLLKFQDTSDNLYTWWTTTDTSSYSIGDEVTITGKIKDHSIDKYENNAKITVLTRPKISFDF